MKISLYLHRDRADVLSTFGNLSDVINRILDAADEGLIDIEDRPACEPRDGAARFDVEITNDNYLQLLQAYGIKSKRISLRRIVYWFVDNEVYNDLGWEPTNDYVDSFNKRLNKLVNNVISELMKLKIFCSGNYMVDNLENVYEIEKLLEDCKR